MATDITTWHPDEIHGEIRRIFLRHNITTKDAGVPEGITELFHTRDDGGKEGRDAEVRFRRLLHVVLNLMRADSRLGFTDEPDPSNWPLHDQIATVKGTMRVFKRRVNENPNKGDDVIAERREIDHGGWGNDSLVNENPRNDENEKGTNDVRPGWWYRMVYDPKNREQVIHSLEFWEPEKVTDPDRRERLADPEQNPRKNKALRIIAETEQLTLATLDVPRAKATTK